VKGRIPPIRYTGGKLVNNFPKKNTIIRSKMKYAVNGIIIIFQHLLRYWGYCIKMLAIIRLLIKLIDVFCDTVQLFY